MTAVIGFNWLTEVVMVADSRVSWANGRYQDNLRKLYILGDGKKSVAVGFSGNLQGANRVLSYLFEKKLPRYHRPFVISQFKNDFGKWIEEISISYPDLGIRGNVRFMLCGIEPSRHPPVIKDGKTIGYAPFVDYQIYKYNIGKNGRVQTNTKPLSFCIIGSGQVLEKTIRKKVEELIGFGYANQNTHWARALLAGDVISSLYKDIGSTTVGGPFEVIRITPSGIETQYVWSVEDENKDLDVSYSGASVIIHNPSSDKTCTLHSIFEYPHLMTR